MKLWNVNAQELLSFLDNKMQMSHVYQPLLIRSLLDRGGSATSRELGADFALGVPEDIDHYEDRIMKMPVPVLTNHGVVASQGRRISLNLDPCTPEEAAEIRQLCDVKISDFLRSKGVLSWNELRSESATPPRNQSRLTSARMPWVSQTALMFPTLHALRELGGSADIDAIAAHVANQLGLTQQEREIPNPGVDTRPKFDYDLAWARTKLHTDGLVTNPSQKIWSLVESRTTPEDELAKSHFLKTPKEAEEVPFEMFGGEDVRRTSERKVRTNQATFRFDVLARYGCECAVCSINESVLIEAAHIVPKADNGSDDVRNGLPLCLLHHKATEKNVALIRIHPETLEVICTGGRSYEELRVTKSSLEELPKLPNKEALEYLWEATGAHLADE